MTGVGATQAAPVPTPASPLPLPAEPERLKAKTRALLEQSPQAGLELVAAGEWIAAPLWATWGPTLRPLGMRRAQFREIVRGYQNELRLWVMGERPWEHCVAGLAGRVVRRLPAGTTEAGSRSRARKRPALTETVAREPALSR